MDFPFLMLILLFPMISALMIAFLPQEERTIIKAVASIGALVPLICSLGVAAYFYFSHLPSDTVAFPFSFAWSHEFAKSFTFGMDGFSLWMVILTTVVGFASVLTSPAQENSRVKEYFLLLLLVVTAALGAFMARSFLLFVFFVCLSVVPEYLLVYIWGTKSRTKGLEPGYIGMKRTMNLFLAIFGILFGVIWLYTKVGFIGFDQVIDATVMTQNSKTLLFGMMAICFLGLSAIFPFHSWATDVYTTAPTALSMLQSGVINKLGLYGLIRLIVMMGGNQNNWVLILTVIALIDIIYSAFVAIAQKDMKYMVAYTGVSSMGFALLGIANSSIATIGNSLIWMLASGLGIALLYAVAGYIEFTSKTRYIPELGGLFHESPFIMGMYFVAMLTLVGFPGLPGFNPLMNIFQSVLGKEEANPILIFFAIAGLLLAWWNFITLGSRIFYGENPKFANPKPDRQYMVSMAILLFFIGANVVFYAGIHQTITLDANYGSTHTVHKRIAGGE